MNFFSNKKIIKRFSPNFITPEDIYLSEKIFKSSAPSFNFLGDRPTFFLLIVIFSFLILVFQTFNFSIFKHEENLNRAFLIQNKILYRPSARGIIFDKNGKVLATNKLNYDVYAIPNFLPKNSDGLEKWIMEVTAILPISAEKIKELLFNQNLFLTKRILLYQTDDIVKAQLIQSKIKDIPGIEVVENFKRYYPYSPYASHILGYTIQKKEFEKEGKDGIEMTMDAILEGQVGKEIFRIDAKGNIISQVNQTSAQNGKDIYLTIDIEAQKKLEDIFEEHLKKNNKKKGAAIVLNPRDGSIIALASFPRFDNNNIAEYLNNPDEPFFNRAISGQYSSGSVIKPAVALAALNENIISPKKNIYVSGSISVPSQFNPQIKYIFKDWKAHGYVDMERALAVSSNVYFYTIGGGFGDIEGLGIERLAKYLKMFNFGSKTGIDLPGEASGLVPDPQWKEKTKKQKWYKGDTYNLSIGQGDLKVSPLQIAFLNQFIANKGVLYRPHLLQTKCVDFQQKCQTAAAQTLNIDKNDLEIVRQGLKMAVLEGSAHLLFDLPVTVAAKTGTAQSGIEREPHSWSSAFAPYDNPQLVITVIVEEGGEGSKMALPIIRDFLKWYFSK